MLRDRLGVMLVGPLRPLPCLSPDEQRALWRRAYREVVTARMVIGNVLSYIAFPTVAVALCEGLRVPALGPYAAGFAVAGGLLVLRWRLDRRLDPHVRRLLREDSRCEECSYQLFSNQSTCPECGVRVK